MPSSVSVQVSLLYWKTVYLIVQEPGSGSTDVKSAGVVLGSSEGVKMYDFT